MAYNLDFIYAALIFLLLTLFHTLENRQWDRKNKKSREFIIFLFIGVLDVLFDWIATIFISMQDERFRLFLEFTLIVLYSLQAIIPYSLFRFIQTLRAMDAYKMRRLNARMVLFALITVVFIFTNHWTKLLFWIDADGLYVRGPLYLGMYINGLIYLLIIAFQTVSRRKELGKRNIGIIWEILLLNFITIGIQVYEHDVLTAGFGIALGLVVLFITTQSPYEYTDNLTGLFDRRYLQQVITSHIASQQQMFLLQITLPKLRQINNTRGMDFGNEVLKFFSRWLLEIHRDNQVFRIGGNEFMILAFSEERYKEACVKLKYFDTHTVEISGKTIAVSLVNAGVKPLENMQSADELLAYLEYLTAQHKAIGNCNNVVMIEGNEQTLKGFQYRKSISIFMEQALREDLFRVVYQPIYSPSEKRFVSLEALSRLKHPVLGEVSPEVFCKLAERDNQITRLGLLQFRKICSFVKENNWILSQIHSVKINLSAQELLDSSHVQAFVDVIKEYGLDSSYFQFEVTETTATEYGDSLNESVDLLQRAGIGLCMDDFGSGYANLNTVLKLPFSVIKLDRSLLTGICEDDKVALFYQSIAGVLDRMDFKVIAEGVEDEQVLEKILPWGIHQVQGYYYSRPLEPEKLLLLLSEETT